MKAGDIEDILFQLMMKLKMAASPGFTTVSPSFLLPPCAFLLIV